jgi:hypothetical protein
MNDVPHWEHGYRCHGYWLNGERIGFIGIESGRGAAKKHGYNWECDIGPLYVYGERAHVAGGEEES